MNKNPSIPTFLNTTTTETMVGNFITENIKKRVRNAAQYEWTFDLIDTTRQISVFS